MSPETFRNLAQASRWSNDWQNLFYLEVGIFVFFSALIFGLILYFGMKYRRRSPDEIPPPTRDNLPLEITWTVIPSGLCVVMFIWGASLFVNNVVAPPSSTEIYVLGKQWMWEIQYPNGMRDINELHVPLGIPTKLTMISQDVIHDFSIPAFRIKRDVVPGHYSTEWFIATKLGRYHLFCDQYCGTSHSAMIGWVTVMTPADYAEWLHRGSPGTSLVERGAELYQQFGCSTCHDTGKAPSFSGLYGSQVLLSNGQTVLADDAYIRESILYPSAKIVAGYQPIMPTYQGQLNEQQILQLSAYIKSLALSGNGGRKAATK